MPNDTPNRNKIYEVDILLNSEFEKPVQDLISHYEQKFNIRIVVVRDKRGIFSMYVPYKYRLFQDVYISDTNNTQLLCLGIRYFFENNSEWLEHCERYEKEEA